MRFDQFAESCNEKSRTLLDLVLDTDGPCHGDRRTYEGIIRGHGLGSSEGNRGVLSRGVHLLGDLSGESLLNSRIIVRTGILHKKPGRRRGSLEDVCFAASSFNACLLLLGQLGNMPVHGVLLSTISLC